MYSCSSKFVCTKSTYLEEKGHVDVIGKTPFMGSLKT